MGCPAQSGADRACLDGSLEYLPGKKSVAWKLPEKSMEFAWPDKLQDSSFGWKPVPGKANKRYITYLKANKRYNTIFKHTRLWSEKTIVNIKRAFLSNKTLISFV